MPSRFSKVLKCSTAGCLASSLVIGVGSSQVFAAVEEDRISFLVNTLVDGYGHLFEVEQNVKRMSTDTCKEIWNRSKSDTRVLLALGMFTVQCLSSVVDGFYGKLGFTSEVEGMDLIKRVFEKSEGRNFLKFISAFDVTKGFPGFRLKLLKKLIQSVGDENFLKKLTSYSNTAGIIELEKYIKANVRCGYAEASKKLGQRVCQKSGVRLPDDYYDLSKDYWENIFTKALSFNGVQVDLEDEKKKVLDLDGKLSTAKSALEDEKGKVQFLSRKLSDAKSDQFYTAVFSIFGTLLSVFSLNRLFGNRHNNSNTKKYSDPFTFQ